MQSETAAPAPPTALHAARHTGRVGELLAITLVNLVLKVLTAGVYHFWGKTRVRRYVWSHTRFDGEPFEYAGRGVELLLGYLVAMALLIPLVLAWQLAPGRLADYPALAAGVAAAGYPALVFLIGFARFSARRYLLSRTRWRGIRFGLLGRATRHGRLMLLYSLLTALSLGLYLPFMRHGLAAHLLNNAWFGDLRLAYRGHAGPLLTRYLITGALLLGLLALWFVAAAALVALLPAALNGVLRPDQLAQVLWMAEVLAGGLGFLAALAVAWSWYLAGELRHLANHSALGPLRVRMDFATGAFMRLYLGNRLALLLTLGLGYAWVVVRTARFLCAHLRLEGPLEPESIGQHPEGVPATGEGLAEAFDLGSI